MSTRRWIKQKDKDHNSVAVMQNLLRALNVKVTDQTVEDVLKENPDYPSLASLSDGLNDWRIENLAVRLDAEDLVDVTFPVIAHLRPLPKTPEEMEAEQQEGPACGLDDEVETPRFVMVSDMDDTQATYLDTNSGWVTEERDVFLKKWTGIMLLVEKKPESGDPDYKQNALNEKLHKLKLPAVLSIAGLIILALVFTGISTQASLVTWLPLLATKLIGSTICILLLIQLVDKDNSLVNKVCNIGSGQTTPQQKPSSCGEGILESEAATLFGWLSMSELGAFYFLGGLLSIAIGLFSSVMTSVSYVLIGLNFLALPYTVFSIYYQKKHAQWCKLCVAVQVVLWIEFAAGALIWTEGAGTFNGYALAVVAQGFLLPVMIWMVFRSELGKEKQLKEFRRQLNIYKRNPAIIKDVLDKGRKLEEKRLPNDVVLGNADSPFSVTIFSNPFCGPCQKAHQLIDQLLDEFADGVRVVFRFSAQGSPRESIEQELERIQSEFDQAQDDIQKQKLKEWYGGDTREVWEKKIKENVAANEKLNSIALTLHALAYLGKTDTLHTAMSEWYNAEDKSNQAIDEWCKKYPVSRELLDQMKPALRDTREWASESGINGTPTVFVNDQELKNGLTYVPDLKYYIRAMEEEMEAKAAREEQGQNMPVIQPV
ncbi:thioredoxin domain-containing protein [Roseivirga sp. BDSF3-8]|uniref:thioredoxin domain-containing protein n=1 Tax=Roseivirga sp. BDSF3-8 TaxID=3241598 RepID=UPI0035327FAD